MSEHKEEVGTQEGETCNRENCTGVIEYQESENCSCHISPPCSSCLSVALHCPDCGWEDA